MNAFEIIASACSIGGLLLSIYLAFRTSSISKSVSKAFALEDFQANYSGTMDNLRSLGLNAIREDFPNPDDMFDFQTELRKYQKAYATILSKQENNDINQLLSLIDNETYSNTKNEYRTLLSKILSKPEIGKEDYHG